MPLGDAYFGRRFRFVERDRKLFLVETNGVGLFDSGDRSVFVSVGDLAHGDVVCVVEQADVFDEV